MGPAFKKKNHKGGGGQKEREREKRERVCFYLFIYLFILFYFFSLLSSIYGNRTVRIRRGKKQSDVLDEGYA